MRATEFITERKVPPIKDQILAAVKKDGGNLDDYFVRFTMNDKLGFNNKQWFPKTLDVDDPNFNVDYIGHKGGKRALWFYPLKTYLEGGHLYAKEQPYVWLVKKKPNAWLQVVKRDDKKLENPPEGKERVGMIRMSNPPAAIFFKPAYELVGKYYDYAGRHKRHGQVKGPPPAKSKSLWQKIKDRIKLDEVPLPPDWDPEQLNLRQTYKDRLKYALDRAKRIGGGSSRVAMTIEYAGRPTVLKVAKNAKGLAQNEAEVEILLDGYASNLPIVIPLIDYDKTNKRPVWLQTELAKKVLAPKLMKLLHTPSMWLFMNQVRNLVGKKGPYDMNDDQIKQKYFETNNKLWQPTEQGYDIFLSYASDLAELGMSTTIELSDFNNPSNWGVYNNRPVIIDLGFTEDTAELYGFNKK